jgi:hypothetical protein
MGMGGCGILLQYPWAALMNPAGLAAADNIFAGIMCSDNFLLPEFAEGTIIMGIPATPGTFCFSFSASGSRGYHESMTSLSFGRVLGDRVNAGVKFDCMRIVQPYGYGSFTMVVPSAGLQVKPIKNLTLAFSIFNPLNRKFREIQDLSSTGYFRGGASFNFGDEALLCFELFKYYGAKPEFMTGIEYYITKYCTIRAGITHRKYAGASAGMSLKNGPLTLDVAFWRHPVLGYSPGISLLYEIN